MHIQPTPMVNHCFGRESDNEPERPRVVGGGGGGGSGAPAARTAVVPGRGTGAGGHRASIERQMHRTTPRSPPVLANGVDLCRQTAKLLKSDPTASPLLPQVSTVISTTYDDHPTLSLSQKIAGNLVLDANLFFEEKLQHTIEQMPETLEGVRRAALLVNEHLEISGVAKKSDEAASEIEFREPRIAYLHAYLAKFFKENTKPIDHYVASADGSDAALNELMKHVPIAERLDARAHAKVLKMLFGQFPYFGGSYEYKQNVAKSFEFWIYHLSTITRDPVRHYPPNPDGSQRLPKPMLDYQTPLNSIVPLHNQRNLGTGVAESDWNNLSRDFKRVVTEGFKRFGQEKNNPPAGVKKYYDSLTPGYQRLLEVGMEHHRTLAPGHIEPQHIWPYLGEDDKKVLFGDIARVPWSAAHLHDGTAFEQQVDINEAGVLEKLKLRHPPRQEKGLMNVAGVFGNVLEKTDIAWGKLKEDFSLSNNSEENLDKMVPMIGADLPYADFKTDFKDKQEDWYRKAYDNHQPIVGGMSGHTLGYLNLYKSALEKSGIDPAQPDSGYPTLEQFRATMLAALIGTKRHHSYNEVMAASTGISAHDETVGYGDRVGYKDILQSSDNKLRKAAGEALEAAKTSYVAQTSSTVLQQIRVAHPAAGRELDRSMRDYYAALAEGETHAINTAKGRIEALIASLIRD